VVLDGTDIAKAVQRDDRANRSRLFEKLGNKKKTFELKSALSSALMSNFPLYWVLLRAY
jgi:hypothetical protein